MASAGTAIIQDHDPAELARLHGLLRFSVAVTATYAISEAMGWYPTFLAPVLAAVILANLPAALPFKAGLAVTLVMAASAFIAYVLPSLLQHRPEILFGLLGLIVFVIFAILASGRGQLPATLLLICVATIPIVTLVAPQQAAALPKAYARGMAVAVVAVWLVYAIWPKTLPAHAKPAVAHGLSPIRLATAGTAIVLPLMLVYLMFGITDALPILITTIFLVVNFDPQRGALHGLAMLIGNFVGGLIALTAYHVLQIAPSLATLTLLFFLISVMFALRIEGGGPRAAVGLITFNQVAIILSIGIASSTSNAGLWITRLFQFALAVTFAVAMMTLAWSRRPSASQ